MNSKKKRKTSLPVYLDEFERRQLEQIAQKWGTNLSNTIKRLIREKIITHHERRH
ncbi:ribbon-helix-helix protein, CopG family (plasmid) [Nostoc sp. UHCC 0302]|uniref:ribbon-helix-helix protein, CopG family n=1 Tax=Nostoc sp. UHCC 0302 TaxID=3134896 RepID=UPI00311CDBA2